MRVKLVVAYEGTNYCGWQIQPNGITIEQVLNEDPEFSFEEEITVTGANRTDAGVHSLGNVAVFETHTKMPAEKISFCTQSAPAGRYRGAGVLPGARGFSPTFFQKQEDI